MYPKKIVFMVGPTASGKTSLSLEIAKKLEMEIVSCDSMQIYKGLDIGTDKVSSSVLSTIPHHMIDIREPGEEYSAFDYRTDCLSVIQAIHGRERTPLVVGGSGLYVKAVCDGLALYPRGSEVVRNELEARADREGLMALYEELAQRDQQRAALIHHNDKKRIIRALEICYQTDSVPTELKDSRESLEDLGYSFLVVGIDRPRAELYEAVNVRVAHMIESGLVSEVDSLRGTLSKTTRQAVGYKEIIRYLEGACSLDSAIYELKKNTRHLVKKQLTWFRKDERIQWVEMDKKTLFDEAVVKMMQPINAFLNKEKM